MSTATSATGSVDEGECCSSLEEDTEDSTDDEYSSEEDGSCLDSDLQELYESFEFEDEAASAVFSEGDNLPPISRRSFGNHDATLLYPDARLMTLQSHLLIFHTS